MSLQKVNVKIGCKYVEGNNISRQKKYQTLKEQEQLITILEEQTLPKSSSFEPHNLVKSVFTDTTLFFMNRVSKTHHALQLGGGREVGNGFLINKIDDPPFFFCCGLMMISPHFHSLFFDLRISFSPSATNACLAT